MVGRVGAGAEDAVFVLLERHSLGLRRATQVEARVPRVRLLRLVAAGGAVGARGARDAVQERVPTAGLVLVRAGRARLARASADERAVLGERARVAVAVVAEGVGEAKVRARVRAAREAAVHDALVRVRALRAGDARGVGRRAERRGGRAVPALAGAGARAAPVVPREGAVAAEGLVLDVGLVRGGVALVLGPSAGVALRARRGKPVGRRADTDAAGGTWQAGDGAFARGGGGVPRARPLVLDRLARRLRPLSRAHESELAGRAVGDAVAEGIRAAAAKAAVRAGVQAVRVRLGELLNVARGARAAAGETVGTVLAHVGALREPFELPVAPVAGVRAVAHRADLARVLAR
mmetsp:Transcript_22725/g.70413  ORF Transcript_22725/g.70413 Transcript_22725/m.70413 type:complete len:350 (+) Transcript_22725:640-1689(+)